MIRNGLDWLLAGAAGAGLPLYEFQEDEDGDIGPHVRAPLEPAQARDALRLLLALRARGLREPLPFAPRSGWKFHTARTVEAGARAAAAQWRGSERQWGEGTEPACELALRARDPFADHASLRDFAAVTTAVFAAVCNGISLPPALDDDALARVPLGEDDGA